MASLGFLQQLLNLQLFILIKYIKIITKIQKLRIEIKQSTNVNNQVLLKFQKKNHSFSQ